MSFWASSYGFQLESVVGVARSTWSCAGYFYDDCKDTRCDQDCYSRLYLFDAMLGRVQTR
jgi:hypothetical protein